MNYARKNTVKGLVALFPLLEDIIMPTFNLNEPVTGPLNGVIANVKDQTVGVSHTAMWVNSDILAAVESQWENG